MAIYVDQRPEDLVGKYVVVVDLEATAVKGKVVRLPESADDEASLDDEVLVNGQQGACLQWIEDESCYVVKTFDNIVAKVPQENLQECAFVMPEQGGFDFIWPPAEFPVEDFAFQVASCISDKGFCVVQMFANAEDREEMLSEANGLQGQRFAQEIDAAYLGFDSNTKAAVSDRGQKADSAPEDAMSSCEDYLTRLSDALKDAGFAGAGRTPTFLRTSYSGPGEELELAPIELDDAVDREEQLEAYLEFIQSRTLSMLLMLENQGGNLWLYPKSFEDTASIKIPITPNKLVIFPHNLADYSYQPVGQSLALQSWLVKGKHSIAAVKDARINPSNYREVLANDLMPEPSVKPAQVLGFDVTMPGNIDDSSWIWWQWFACSGDGFQKVPQQRWDVDTYFDVEQDPRAILRGLCYTAHGGFCETEMLSAFDPSFFGLDKVEAACLLPPARVLCQKGARTLAISGYSMKELNGECIGVHVGDSGPDWGSYTTEWAKYMPEGLPFNKAIEYGSSAMTASRLSYLFGMKGRTCQYDTACSSSLTALNAAHSPMMDGADDPEHQKALIMATNCMLGPRGYLACTQTQMLSFVGRSFTFNASADGYGRGEGMGSLFMKRDATQDEIESRVGCIIGSVCGQDGRSASITAPSGPAQTFLIKKSIGFSGVKATDYSITECHGTGTALGDPIETGAFQNVQVGRQFPLLVVTTKSHIGHLEPSAGMAGVTKCMMMLRMGTAPGNCHLRKLNDNITMEGFPWFFMSEAALTNVSSASTGVSSFGFCGTDTRCNVFEYVEKGPLAAVRVALPAPALPRHQFSQDDDILIVGSWSRWFEFEEMSAEDDGMHTFEVTLGESRVESFRLILSDILGNDEDNLMIYPATKDADWSAQVLGPDQEDRGRSWKIDGIADGQPAGAKYRIIFSWGSQKQVWWELVDESA